MNSHELNVFQTSSLINQRNNAISQYAFQIKYYESVGEADLLHDVKHLYETEKQRLEELWKKIKAKGEDFLKEVFVLVKNFFEKYPLNSVIPLQWEIVRHNKTASQKRR